jgi:hypothetical protein
MGDEQKIVEHLKMIQPIVTRMSSAMFSVKTLCLTIFSLFVGFAIKDNLFYLSIIIFPFIILFLFLDLSYHRQEKLFRKLYNDIRNSPTTDFSMDTEKFSKSTKLITGFKSIAISPFYITLIVFNSIVFIWELILKVNS